MIERVVYVSMHTSPLLPPGEGDAGGMNVYIDELARTMARRGLDVTVLTRRASATEPEIIEVSPHYRVVHIEAGPATPLPVAALPPLVGAFAERSLGWLRSHGVRPDVIHSHYWLSGWVGVILKEVLGVPLANSFHTLGRVKDLTRRPDERPSSPVRTLTETEVIARSDCVIASTPHELEDLLDHYGAVPERVCVSPPGVDHDLFRPGDKRQARRGLGWPAGEPTVLFVGRIQPLKGVDVAIAALAELEGATAGPRPRLVVTGGPSGPEGEDELHRLRLQVNDLGVADQVSFLPPQPHHTLPRLYRAADALVMPSRSESFGLVAVEAQACGLPVVAASVGGLRHVVDDGRSGILVDRPEADAYAKALWSILSDSTEAARLSEGAIHFSQRFSWAATAHRLTELYSGISARAAD